ncbi:MAG: biotin-dependent carboxyltransferase family protein [Candidatus Eremiobacteraeota bacterium]|nr:biotin-dependent carboxyltransferase family protein [Candidatus Eremiobacteraeota bacterium]
MTAPASVEILDPGLLSTVQDRGRSGVAELGVSPSGSADWLSARAANRLVSNAQNAPLIEATVTGISFRALRDVRIAVTGADAQLTVAGGKKPLWNSFRVRAGSEVKLRAAERGLRSYIAFYGGIDVPLVFGSASTDVSAGFGGLGRPLARGDTLSLHEIEGDIPEGSRSIRTSARPFWRQPATLRVLLGPHASRFAAGDLTLLCSQLYRVSPRSNRQGLRLEGKPLAGYDGFDVLSCGVCAGCVQLQSDGLPVVLLAEHQTTGGYAVPLTVITADLPDAAQLRPGDEVQLAQVTLAQAGVALVEKMQALSEAPDESNPAG